MLIDKSILWRLAFSRGLPGVALAPPVVVGKRVCVLWGRRRGQPLLILRHQCSLLLLLGVSHLCAQEFTPVIDANKTDALLLRNGTELIGEFKELERGIATLGTDAAGTVYVKWPRVVTATTSKAFQIYLQDGRSYLGSLQSSDNAYRVIIRGVKDTLEVPIGAIAKMIRLKSTFWQRLDGSVDIGFNFTQQNSKIDLLFDLRLRYSVKSSRFALKLEDSFGRQDAISDIERRELGLAYARELGKRWFMIFGTAARRNTQLSLDRAVAILGGPGRYLFATHRATLMAFVAPGYRRERYVNEDSQTAVPLSMVMDLEWFTWSRRSSDLSSRLSIAPVLNIAGRWLVYFDASLKHELLKDFYLKIGINQASDSKPPGDAKKHDISLSTSLGWAF